MALEMQFLQTMKRTMGAILSLILVSGLNATAEESACVKSFRKANAEFFKTHAQIQRRQDEATGGVLVGVAVGLGCAAVRRTVMGAVGCGSLGASLGGASYFVSVIQEAKYKQLFDAHRLYQAYYAYIEGDVEHSEFAQAFLKDLGVDVQKEQAALKELAALMEWGSLCEGEQPRSYEEALELMKGRLHAVN